MKLIGSWDAKYIGIHYKDIAYYLAWTHPEFRFWFYLEDYYDGPIKQFGLWYINFTWHYLRMK